MRGTEVRSPGMRAAISAVREIVFRDLGVPLPPGRLAANAQLPARHVDVETLGLARVGGWFWCRS